MNQYKQPFLALGLFILSLLPIFADGQVRMRTDVGSRVLGEIMPEDSSEHRHIVDSLIEDIDYADFSIPLSFSMTKGGNKAGENEARKQETSLPDGLVVYLKLTHLRSNSRGSNLRSNSRGSNVIDPILNERGSAREAKKGKLMKRKFEQVKKMADRLVKTSQLI